jgi:hypothetical protein
MMLPQVAHVGTALPEFHRWHVDFERSLDRAIEGVD